MLQPVEGRNPLRRVERYYECAWQVSATVARGTEGGFYVARPGANSIDCFAGPDMIWLFPGLHPAPAINYRVEVTETFESAPCGLLKQILGRLYGSGGPERLKR